MRTVKQKKEFLSAVLSGNKQKAKQLMRSGVEYPLFWQKQGKRYVAGPLFDVSEAEYQEISKPYPCFIIDEKDNI